MRVLLIDTSQVAQILRIVLKRGLHNILLRQDVIDVLKVVLLKGLELLNGAEELDKLLTLRENRLNLPKIALVENSNCLPFGIFMSLCLVWSYCFW